MANSLFVAWRSSDLHRQGWGPVGILDHDGQTYQFCYTQGAKTLQDFRPFPGMPDLEQVYESETLFPLFANRLLLSRSRPEYEAFLTWSGFDPDNPLDPIAVLGVTEGARQTDAVEVFPCPVPDTDGCFVNKFFLHGVRWIPADALERIDRLHPEEQLFVIPDPTNEYDPNAVAVLTGDEQRIGFVPRYLARDVLHLLNECDPDAIELFVNRVNRDAPLQQRVLCLMRACWPEGFQPCSGDAFQPVPISVPSKREA